MNLNILNSVSIKVSKYKIYFTIIEFKNFKF